ncbi:MAG: TRAP transporter small permease [Thermodesulfobacteriota bacterium]|nr:TRAP transporter small permease [Thermodesulfobacteriota bacterium]
MNGEKGIVRIWNKVEEYMVGILAGVATFLAFYSVLLRYVFKTSAPWVEEVVVYMIIWASFLVASILLAENRHIGADFLVERIPPKARRVVEVVTTFLTLGFCLVVAYYAVEIVSYGKQMGLKSGSRLEFPMWVVHLSVVVGATLLILRHIQRLSYLFWSPQKIVRPHGSEEAEGIDELKGKEER